MYCNNVYIGEHTHRSFSTVFTWAAGEIQYRRIRPTVTIVPAERAFSRGDGAAHASLLHRIVHHFGDHRFAAELCRRFPRSLRKDRSRRIRCTWNGRRGSAKLHTHCKLHLDVPNNKKDNKRNIYISHKESKIAKDKKRNNPSCAASPPLPPHKAVQSLFAQQNQLSGIRKTPDAQHDKRFSMRSCCNVHKCCEVLNFDTNLLIKHTQQDNKRCHYFQRSVPFWTLSTLIHTVVITRDETLTLSALYAHILY